MKTAQAKSRHFAGALVCIMVFGAMSCAGPGIQTRLEVVRGDIEKARKSGAYTCAPRELALSETHADFTETELAQGNFLRAEEHIDVAVENVQNALANSKGCGPKRVLIKNASTGMATEFPTTKTHVRTVRKILTAFRTKRDVLTLTTIMTGFWTHWTDAPWSLKIWTASTTTMVVPTGIMIAIRCWMRTMSVRTPPDRSRTRDVLSMTRMAMASRMAMTIVH